MLDIIIVDGMEVEIEIKEVFTISKQNYEDFKEEYEKLIEKYRI